MLKRFLAYLVFTLFSYEDLVKLIYSNPVVQSYISNQVGLAKTQFEAAQPKQEVVVVEQYQYFGRFSPEMYEALEKEVQSNALVTSQTSDVEAGFKLGVQHVLAKLRGRYVIERM